MSNLLEEVKNKAKTLNKTIVFPEGNDSRIVNAAVQITKEGIAKVILLGNKEAISQLCPNVSLKGIKIIDPKTCDISSYVNTLYELRKSKGMTLQDAEKLCRDEMYLGVLMVKNGEADGMVGGAIHSTGDMLRPGLQVIKTAPGINTVSSCFIMVLPKDSIYGENNTMVFGDCAVNINPTAEQLADIAIASAASAKTIAGIKEPKVAMLSFSSMGSAKHEFVDKVQKATQIAKELAPTLAIDGELQLDAAIVEKVGSLKAPNSTVAGKANVLIFPDLQSGNIGYKLVERLAGAEAVGPICQGFNKPLNDLSRGCSIDDIINVAAITVMQASNK